MAAAYLPLPAAGPRPEAVFCCGDAGILALPLTPFFCHCRLSAEDVLAAGEPDPGKLGFFRGYLAELARHPNQDYYVLKQIIMNNLYGVDIMKEAVEICKLRLFLKLAAQLTRPRDIEPLPDIDFNVKAGNTLIGYASRGDVKADASVGPLGLTTAGALDEVLEKADQADMAYNRFRQAQLGGALKNKPAGAKAALNAKLDGMREVLDRFLYEDYGHAKNGAAGEAVFQAWREARQPFHWLVEFYGIMRRGGFDAVIGNPPYKALSPTEARQFRGYATATAKNLYPLVLERCDALVNDLGYQGYIVPVSVVSTSGYKPLQKIISQRTLFYSAYSDRPSKLFDNVYIRFSILLMGKHGLDAIYASKYHYHFAAERDLLLREIEYCHVGKDDFIFDDSLPKMSKPIELDILRKLKAQKKNIATLYDGNRS